MTVSQLATVVLVASIGLVPVVPPEHGNETEASERAIRMKDKDSDEFRWDWVTLTVALLVVVVLVALTFELWASHGLVPHLD